LAVDGGGGTDAGMETKPERADVMYVCTSWRCRVASSGLLWLLVRSFWASFVGVGANCGAPFCMPLDASRFKMHHQLKAIHASDVVVVEMSKCRNLFMSTAGGAGLTNSCPDWLGVCVAAVCTLQLSEMAQPAQLSASPNASTTLRLNTYICT